MAQTAKRFLILLATISSVTALAACSQPTADNSTEQPGTEQATGTSETTTTAPDTTVSATPPAPDATVSATPPAPDATTEAVATDGTDSGAALVSNESESVVGIASSSPSFSTFTQAVEAAGLTETLAGDGAYTVFAPTDEAFAALPAGTLEELLKPENKEQLVKVLQYHVLPTEVASSQIQPGEVPTVEGSNLNLELVDGKVKVNGAEVVQPDINGSNGVIHVIDQVILPPDATQPDATQPGAAQPDAAQPDAAQ